MYTMILPRRPAAHPIPQLLQEVPVDLTGHSVLIDASATVVVLENYLVHLLGALLERGATSVLIEGLRTGVAAHCAMAAILLKETDRIICAPTAAQRAAAEAGTTEPPSAA